jgi:hypothetical protein
MLNVETDLAEGRVPRDEWCAAMTDSLRYYKSCKLSFEVAWPAALKDAGKPPKLWTLRVQPEASAHTFFRRHAEAAYNDAPAPPKHCQTNGCMNKQPCSRHGYTAADWPEIAEDNDSLTSATRIEVPADAIHCLMCGRKHSPGDETHGKPELEAA